jgi:outer membrane protein
MGKRGRIPREIGGFLIVFLAFAAVAGAEPAPARPSTPDWTFTLGIEGGVWPTYDGSARYTLRPFPIFDVRRAATPRQFRARLDGASVGVIETGTFRLGPTAKIKLPRREGDDTDLRGLGDVGWAFEAGGFIEYWPVQWLRTRAELRQGFGGHHGLVSEFTSDLVAPVTKQLTLSGGPRVTFATGAAMSPYFSITPSQAAASGLPAYDAGGGLRSFGVGAQARYEWSPKWATHLFIEYERLAGSAANSPLVTLRGSRDQVSVGIGLSYSFDSRGLW